MPNNKYLHTLRVSQVGPAKLGFVKVIKDCTGYGLKDSKDIVDTWAAPSVKNGFLSMIGSSHLERDKSLILHLTTEQAENLRKDLRYCGVDFVLEGREVLRDEKLIALGIIADDDMRNLGIQHDVKALKEAVISNNDDFILSWIKNGFRGWNKLSDEEVKIEFKKRI